MSTPRTITNPPRPGTPEWRQVISASKIPTILGLNPWQTANELWMIMAGLHTPDPLEGEHLEWGHVAEQSLAAWWQHKNPGWQLNAGEIAYTNEALPFPNQATLDRRARRGRRFHIIECKTSTDVSTWDHEDELPAHVHAQILAQQGISGIHQATCVSQLGSAVPRMWDVQWDPELWDGIVGQVADFVATLGNAEPPQPPADLLDALAAARIDLSDTPDKVDLPPDDPDVLEIRRLQIALDEAKDDLEQARRSLATRIGGPATVDGKALLVKTSGRFSEKRIPDEARHLLLDPDVLTSKLDPKKLAAKYPDLVASARGDDTYTLRKLA